MITRDQLERQLWDRVVQNSGQYRFSPNCEDRFKSLLTDSVKGMDKQGLLIQTDRIEYAKASIDLVVDKMIQEANRQGIGEFQEATLLVALDDVCPLWPFC